MLWSKSTIKSKKEKNMQKDKDQQSSKRAIEILSSDQQPDEQVIEKRRLSKSIVPTQPSKFNQFDLKKIRKIEYRPIATLQDEGLCVVDTIDPLDDRQKNQKDLITYKIDGELNVKYVSQLFLTTRVNKINQSIEKENLEIKNTSNNTDLENKPEPEVEEKQQYRRHIRYFQQQEEVNEQERVVKCFRCNKRGHIAKNCIEQREPIKCIFCLGNHHHHDCSDRTCFRCNEVGHVKQECRSTATMCNRCGKLGHLAHQCGVLLFLDYHKQHSDKQMKEKYDYTDLKKLKCLNGCKDSGHFNCFQYNQKKKKPYEQKGRRASYY